MPLSEDEQRILQEMERGYYQRDRRSAQRIGETTLARYLARNCRWAALGFVVGLVVLLVSFSSSWLLAGFGFLVMVASATWFTHNLRRMGRHGWQQLMSLLHKSNVNERMEETRRRLKRRLGEGD